MQGMFNNRFDILKLKKKINKKNIISDNRYLNNDIPQSLHKNTKKIYYKVCNYYLKNKCNNSIMHLPTGEKYCIINKEKYLHLTLKEKNNHPNVMICPFYTWTFFECINGYDPWICITLDCKCKNTLYGQCVHENFCVKKHNPNIRLQNQYNKTNIPCELFNKGIWCNPIKCKYLHVNACPYENKNQICPLLICLYKHQGLEAQDNLKVLNYNSLEFPNLYNNNPNINNNMLEEYKQNFIPWNKICNYDENTIFTEKKKNIVIEDKELKKVEDSTLVTTIHEETIIIKKTKIKKQLEIIPLEESINHIVTTLIEPEYKYCKVIDNSLIDELYNKGIISKSNKKTDVFLDIYKNHDTHINNLNTELFKLEQQGIHINKIKQYIVNLEEQYNLYCLNYENFKNLSNKKKQNAKNELKLIQKSYNLLLTKINKIIKNKHINIDKDNNDSNSESENDSEIEVKTIKKNIDKTKTFIKKNIFNNINSDNESDNESDTENKNYILSLYNEDKNNDYLMNIIDKQI